MLKADDILIYQPFARAGYDTRSIFNRFQFQASTLHKTATV